MKDETDRLFYLGAGPVVAIFLGAALVLVRDWTTASNFSFVFLALIIGVAEFGGRAAALATAVASTLSLDFFLTQPYLTLSISAKGDVIACAGLAGCGLLVAVLSDRRPGRAAQQEMQVLHAVMDALLEPGSLETRVGRAARRCCDRLPLAAIVVRDSRNRVVAASAGGEIARPVPSRVFGALPGREEGASTASEALPREGARLALLAGERELGWLEFWGDGTPAERSHLQTLRGVASVLTLSLGGEERAPGVSAA
ncbi:MAG TPA: DUF4118 domain-containing protein [Vicinamibacteria bacterium]|nr:DUF4118 domain-containing protein [Vicinamibacteria bacterium]